MSRAGAIYIKQKYQVESYIILVIQSRLWGWFWWILDFFYRANKKQQQIIWSKVIFLSATESVETQVVCVYNND